MGVSKESFDLQMIIRRKISQERRPSALRALKEDLREARGLPRVAVKTGRNGAGAHKKW